MLCLLTASSLPRAAHKHTTQQPPQQPPAMSPAVQPLLSPCIPLRLSPPLTYPPPRLFQELDFPWPTSRRWLHQHLATIVALVKAEVAAFYEVYNSEVIVSLRTTHKVHINFPDIITTEKLALRCRQKVRGRQLEAAGGWWHHCGLA
jgi:hypothetical protein